MAPETRRMRLRSSPSRQERGRPLTVLLFGLMAIILVQSAAVSAAKFNLLVLQTMSISGRLYSSFEVYASYATIPIAIQHFNDRDGSILPFVGNIGRYCDATLRLVDDKVIDDQALSSVAMAYVVDALSTDPVDLMMGPALADVAQTVAITAGALNIPMISHLTPTEQFNDKSTYPSMFRVIPTDDQTISLVVQLLVKYNYKIIGLLHDSGAYGSALRDSLTIACEAKNIRVRAVIFDISLTGDALETQLSRALLVLKDENINIIMRTSHMVDHELIMAKVATRLDWVKGKLYFARLPSNLQDVMEAAKLANMTETVRSFLLGSIGIHNEIPAGYPPNTRLNKAVRSFNVTYINSFLPDNMTASGQSYKLDQDYFLDQPASSPTIGAAYDAIIALGLAACGKSKSDLTANLMNVRFTGTTGTIIFDAKGNRITREVSNGLSVVLTNFIGSSNEDGIDMVTFAVSSNGTLNLLKPVVFNSGSTTPPPDLTLPPPSIDRVPFGAKVWAWIETVIGTAAGVWALAQLFLIESGKKAFAQSQPTQLAIMATGATLMALSIMALTFENDVGCMLYLWLFALGFMSILAALTAKSVYIIIKWKKPAQSSNAIALQSGSSPDASLRASLMDGAVGTQPQYNSEASKAERTYMGILRAPGESGERWRRMISVCIKITIICGTCAFLIVYQVTAPLKYTFLVLQKDEDGRPLALVASCAGTSESSNALNLALICILAGTMILTFGLALYTRNAPEMFQDAKMTAVAGLCIFQVFFIGLPTIATVWQSSLSRFLVQSSMAFVICLVIITTMFVPKIYHWRFRAFNLFPLRSSGSRSGEGAVRDNGILTNQRSDNVDTKHVTGGPNSSVYGGNALSDFTKVGSKVGDTDGPDDGFGDDALTEDDKRSPFLPIEKRMAPADFIQGYSKPVKMLPSFVNAAELQQVPATTHAVPSPGFTVPQRRAPGFVSAIDLAALGAGATSLPAAPHQVQRRMPGFVDSSQLNDLEMPFTNPAPMGNLPKTPMRYSPHGYQGGVNMAADDPFASATVVQSIPHTSFRAVELQTASYPLPDLHASSGPSNLEGSNSEDRLTLT